MPPRRAKKVDYSQFAAQDSGTDDDVVMSAPSEVEEDEEEEIPEIQEPEQIDTELKELVKPKKKTKKQIKLEEKEAAAAAAAATDSTKAPKREIWRHKDISSVKDKYLRLYGSNNNKLVDLIQLRQEWEPFTTKLNKESIKESYLPLLPSIDIPKTKYNTLSKSQFDEKFPLDNNKINFQFGDDEIIKLEQNQSINKEDTTVLSTGLLITDLVWLNQKKNSNVQYLAVAGSNITNNSTSENFSILSKHSYPSVIQIYQIDINTRETKLITSILHNWGNLWDLKIVPIDSKNNLISAVFNDGNLRVIEINNLSQKYLEIESPSFNFSLGEHIISTYDWIEDYKLVCGTDTGYVAEFSIADNDLTPSYFHLVHSSYIYSLSAAVSKYDETVFFTLCADGSSMIFGTKDLIGSINKISRSKVISKTVIYSPLLYAFIQTEGPYAAKSVPARAGFASASISKHDGSIESLASSSLHPFILSGGADGKIKTANLVKRQLSAPKQSRSSHSILTLFELQFGKDQINQEGIFRLLKPLLVEKINSVDSINGMNIYPSQISINALSWNSNNETSNWFAAGSTSGLLILHDL